MTRRILCASFVLSIFAFADADGQAGQWMIDFQPEGQIQLTLHREHHESSFPVAVDSFQGLSRESTHFKFVRDAGSFICDGRFQGTHGAGTFVFESNPKFLAEMHALGYTIAPDRIIDMAVFDVSSAFVHELDSMGYHGLSLDDLVSFRIHGVSIAYIRNFQNAGYKSLGSEDLVRMRIHGVSIAVVQALDSYGYHHVPVEELIRMQIHGVTPGMVKKVRDAGFAHPTTDQLVEMRIHGLLD